MSTTHTVPRVTATSSMVTSTRRDDDSRVGDRGALGEWQSQHLAVWVHPAGQQEEGVAPEDARGCSVGDVGDLPPVARPSWARTKTCHSPPSPFCTRSITQRPSGEEDRKFSAIRSSAKTPVSSLRSAPPSRGRGTRPAGGTRSVRHAAGPGAGVPEAASLSWRQASEPPIRCSRAGSARRPARRSPTSYTCRVPSSVPCSDSETATRRAVGGGDEPVDVRRARGSTCVGVEHRPARWRGRRGRSAHTSNGCCRGGCSLRAKKRRRPPCRREYVVDSSRRISSTRPRSRPPGDRVEVGAGARLLGGGPRPRLLGRGVLQPAVVLGHLDPVVGRRSRARGGSRPRP